MRFVKPSKNFKAHLCMDRVASREGTPLSSVLERRSNLLASLKMAGGGSRCARGVVGLRINVARREASFILGPVSKHVLIPLTR